MKNAPSTLPEQTADLVRAAGAIVSHAQQTLPQLSLAELSIVFATASKACDESYSMAMRCAMWNNMMRPR